MTGKEITSKVFLLICEHSTLQSRVMIKPRELQLNLIRQVHVAGCAVKLEMMN